MNRQLYLSIVTVFVILCGCSQNPIETPNSSALGASPTITGNISDLRDANLGGTSLKVKAKIGFEVPFGTDVIAEGNVAANGDFSIKLPGIATLEDDLEERDSAYYCDSDTLTVTPEMYRSTGFLWFMLFSNNQYVKDLYYVNGTLVGGQNEVYYSFSDRDISIKGTCDYGDLSRSFDLDMKKGWNIVIAGRFPDGQRSGLRTAVPDSSFKWLLDPCTAALSPDSRPLLQPLVPSSHPRCVQ